MASVYPKALINTALCLAGSSSCWQADASHYGIRYGVSKALKGVHCCMRLIEAPPSCRGLHMAASEANASGKSMSLLSSEQSNAGS